MATEVKILKAHLALNVRDVESSVGFYRLLLGTEPSKVRAGRPGRAIRRGLTSW